MIIALAQPHPHADAQAGEGREVEKTQAPSIQRAASSAS